MISANSLLSSAPNFAAGAGAYHVGLQAGKRNHLGGTQSPASVSPRSKAEGLDTLLAFKQSTFLRDEDCGQETVFQDRVSLADILAQRDVPFGAPPSTISMNLRFRASGFGIWAVRCKTAIDVPLNHHRQQYTLLLNIILGLKVMGGKSYVTPFLAPASQAVNPNIIEFWEFGVKKPQGIHPNLFILNLEYDCKVLVAEWIHFTLFGILLPTIKLKVFTFGGL